MYKLDAEAFQHFILMLPVHKSLSCILSYVIVAVVYVIFACRAKEMIMKAIHNNDFLRNLENVQVTEIVDCMYERQFKKDQYICREGGVGTQLYVIAG